MLSRKLITAGVLACIPLASLISGCSLCNADPVQHTAAPIHKERTVKHVADFLPPGARTGECYVKVFIPEKFETTKESVCVREASERIEIVPARYEWVEETILVKDASTIIEEIPARFELQERTVMVDPGHTGWQVEKTAKCVSHKEQKPADEMYCLVSHEPVYKTISTEVMVKPVTTRTVNIPAEYQTVRRQKLVAPATTRRIPIPAEFASIDKVRMVSDSRVEWQRVDCEPDTRAEIMSVEKEVLATTSYLPAPK